jgi:hypothetical protein
MDYKLNRIFENEDDMLKLKNKIFDLDFYLWCGKIFDELIEEAVLNDDVIHTIRPEWQAGPPLWPIMPYGLLEVYEYLKYFQEIYINSIDETEFHFRKFILLDRYFIEHYKNIIFLHFYPKIYEQLERNVREYWDETYIRFIDFFSSDSYLMRNDDDYDYTPMARMPTLKSWGGEGRDIEYAEKYLQHFKETYNKYLTDKASSEQDMPSHAFDSDLAASSSDLVMQDNYMSRLMSRLIPRNKKNYIEKIIKLEFDPEIYEYLIRNEQNHLARTKIAYHLLITSDDYRNSDVVPTEPLTLSRYIENNQVYQLVQLYLANFRAQYEEYLSQRKSESNGGYNIRKSKKQRRGSKQQKRRSRKQI